MTTAQDILKEAARIVRTELPKHLTGGFVINNVEAENPAWAGRRGLHPRQRHPRRRPS